MGSVGSSLMLIMAFALAASLTLRSLSSSSSSILPISVAITIKVVGSGNFSAPQPHATAAEGWRRMDFSLSGDGEELHGIFSSRRLKEDYFTVRKSAAHDAPSVIVEDYPRYDPVPSSKAAVKPGPIEHGAPLLPYIPGPAPPPPKGDGHP